MTTLGLPKHPITKKGPLVKFRSKSGEVGRPGNEDCRCCPPSHAHNPFSSLVPSEFKTLDLSSPVPTDHNHSALQCVVSRKRSRSCSLSSRNLLEKARQDRCCLSSGFRCKARVGIGSLPVGVQCPFGKTPKNDDFLNDCFSGVSQSDKDDEGKADRDALETPFWQRKNDGFLERENKSHVETIVFNKRNNSEEQSQHHVSGTLKVVASGLTAVAVTGFVMLNGLRSVFLQ